MTLTSDPVRCPFCTKSDFGVIYNPPTWLPRDASKQDSPLAMSPLGGSEIDLPNSPRVEMYPPGHERVVLSDHIRPDWYQGLALRRRIEARRLATATALQQALALAGQRRRSHLPGQSRMNFEQRRIGRRVEGMIRITRDEADEMMLQEAIRMSLQTEEEERRKREEEEERKRESASRRVRRETSRESGIVPPMDVVPPTDNANDRMSDEGNRAVSPSQPLNPVVHDLLSDDAIPNTILPEALLSTTSASLAAAMQDTITPCSDGERTVTSDHTSKQDENGQTVEQREVVNVG
jgi:hypothetical protein